MCENCNGNDINDNDGSSIRTHLQSVYSVDGNCMVEHFVAFGKTIFFFVFIPSVCCCCWYYTMLRCTYKMCYFSLHLSFDIPLAFWLICFSRLGDVLSLAIFVPEPLSRVNSVELKENLPCVCVCLTKRVVWYRPRGTIY